MKTSDRDSVRKSKRIFHAHESLWDTELDEYVGRLETAYSSSEHVDLLSFAPKPDNHRYADIVRELIRVDLELSANRGEVRSLDHYQAMFNNRLDFDAIREDIEFERARIASSNAESNFGADKLEASFPKVGDLVCGFRLEGELGRGAFGRVFLAEEKQLSNRRVVLKISSLFPGEADLLARLQHKNIVPIYSLHKHEHWHVVCMPMLGTATLGELIDAFIRSGKLPHSGIALVDTIRVCNSETFSDKSPESAGKDEESAVATLPVDAPALARLRKRFESYSYAQSVLWVVSQLASGLEHAHERNILHRDVKPANILLSDDGVPMLLDFNLATENVATNPENAFGGTPRYMAPEQLREVVNDRRESDCRSDVYSLGVILYELLTLASPFPERMGSTKSVLKLMELDRRALPGINVDRKAGMTSGVCAIVRKALSFAPDQRYQSAADFREDLERELNHQPLSVASGESLRDRATKWNLRHPRLSTGTLSLVVLTLATLVGLGVFWKQSSDLAIASARQWINEARSASTIAGGLVVATGMPEGQVQELVSRTEEAILSYPSKAFTGLSGEEREQAQKILGHLYLLNSRGNASLALAGIDPLAARKYLELSLRSAKQVGDYDRESSGSADSIVRLVSAAMDSIRNEPSAPINKGNLLEQLKSTETNLDAAILAATTAIDTDASNPWYWASLAQMQLAAGDRDSAINNLHISAYLDDDLVWTQLLLGSLEMEEGNYRKALEYFEHVVEVEPSNVVGIMNRALANFRLGEFNAALVDLNSIESRAEQFPRILFIRELTHRRLKDLAAAKSDLHAGLKLEPTDASGWNARGEARLRVIPPDPDGALADFKQAAAIAPHHRNYYENMAHVLSEYLLQPEAAIEALTQAIECDDEYALAWSSRSVLNARLGRTDEAIADAERALRIDRSPVVCYQVASTFALVRRNNDDEAKALQLLKETAKRDSDLAALMPNDKDLSQIKDKQTLRRIVEAAKFLR